MQRRIKFNRDMLARNDKVLICSHIFKPMISHAAHLFYAPEEAVMKIGSKCWNCTTNYGSFCNCERLKFYLGATDENFRDECSCMGLVCSVLRKNFLFALVTAAFFGAFWLKGKMISCKMQLAMTSFAAITRQKSWLMKFPYIALLMTVRLLVSNVLPFTSPVFAYLVSKCMNPDMGYLGVFYMLICSMPAGAVIPFFDAFLSCCTNGRGDHRFRFTRLMSWITDHLPFSFWVKCFFMEPVFEAADREFYATSEAARPRRCSPAT